MLLAVVDWFRLGWLAGRPATKPSAQGLPAVVSGTLIKAVASAGQMLVPVFFLLVAMRSGWRMWRCVREKAHATSRTDSDRAPLDRRAPSVGATQDDSARRDLYRDWKQSGRSPATATLDTSKWSLALLRALEWKRFEDVCAGLFERLGFTPQVAQHGADGRIDIRLFQGAPDRPVAIVQCKAWRKTVGVDVVRELRGVMAAEGVTEGIFVATRSVTPDAVAFARDNHIDLMDGAAVLKAIATLGNAQQASLLALATAGDFTTPTCASCGIKLVWRTPASGARSFWGCTNYPRGKMRMYMAE